MSDRDPCTRCKGTGKEPRQPSRDQVTAWMTANGWQPGPDGIFGAIWRNPEWPSSRIGVPSEFSDEGFEYRSVIQRLAPWYGCTDLEMGERIAAWAEAGES